MAHMDIWRRGVDTQFHSQRPAFLLANFQALDKFILADQVYGPAFDDANLIFYRFSHY
jgi:hypothetical protein